MPSRDTLPSHCRRAFVSTLLAATVALLGLSCVALVGEAASEPEYYITDITDNRLISMADAILRCREINKGTLPIIRNTVEEEVLRRSIEEYRARYGVEHAIYVMLGGSVSGKDCGREPAQDRQKCRWCWDYGSGDCGQNNEKLIARGLDPDMHSANNAYNNWHPGHPYAGFGAPYIMYIYSTGMWWPEKAEFATELVCVYDVSNDQSAPTQPATTLPATKEREKSFPWLAVGIAAGVALIVIVAAGILCYSCCCASKQPAAVTLADVQSYISTMQALPSHCPSARSIGNRRCSQGFRQPSFRDEEMYEYDEDDLDEEMYDDQPTITRKRSVSIYYY